MRGIYQVLYCVSFYSGCVYPSLRNDNQIVALGFGRRNVMSQHAFKHGQLRVPNCLTCSSWLQGLCAQTSVGQGTPFPSLFEDTLTEDLSVLKQPVYICVCAVDIYYLI